MSYDDSNNVITGFGRMESVNYSDLRVQKTLAVIQAAFESMMLEYPYNKITVTALCERARINKKTFYRYYSTLDDLLEETEKRFGTAYIERTSGLHYPDDLERITREFLEFSAEQGPLYDAIVCSSRHEEIFDKVVNEMEAERYEKSAPPKGWTPEEWKLYMKGVTLFQWRVYRQWVEDGRVVPLERMVDIACSLLVKGATLK